MHPPAPCRPLQLQFMFKNSLFSGVGISIIHDFLCLLKTALQKRTAQKLFCKENNDNKNIQYSEGEAAEMYVPCVTPFTCCCGVSRHQTEAQHKEEREQHLWEIIISI